MSSSLSPHPPLGPLSVVNVVSTGLKLYRADLKQYWGLSLKAHLWVLVPVYGWAKFSAISALISRLAFCELVSQPESVTAAQNRVNSKLWSFLIAAILVALILAAASIGLYIAVIVVTLPLAAVGFGIGQNPFAIAVLTLLGVVFFMAFLAALVWIYSRYVITELPLAIEENVRATSAIRRSWNLTKGFALRVQGTVLLAALISILLTLPIQIAAWWTQSLLQIETTPEPLSTLLSVLLIALSLASSSIIMPYWQAIKAVLYYDLRSRREGLDLQLPDRF